jgi:outer membrane protein TolC
VAESSLNAVMGEDMSRRLCPQTPLSQADLEAKGLNDWMDIALADRPDLMQLILQEQSAGAEINKSKSAYLPTVSLNGGYEWDTEDFDDMADNYTVGANVTFNLFSGGQTLYKTQTT